MQLKHNAIAFYDKFLYFNDVRIYIYCLLHVNKKWLECPTVQPSSIHYFSTRLEIYSGTNSSLTGGDSQWGTLTISNLHAINSIYIF